MTTLTSGPAMAMTISSDGFLGNARQARQAAERQERDVGCRDAVAARRQRVAELVKKDADEDGNDESDAVDAAAAPRRG